MKTIKEFLKKILPDKEKEIDMLELPESELEKAKNNSDGDEVTGELKQLVKTQQLEIQKLLKELNDVKEKEMANQKLIEDKAKREKQEQINLLLKKAVEDLKIPSKNEELINKYRSLLEKDFESGKVIIDNLPKMMEDKNAKQPPRRDEQSDQPKISPVKAANKILQNILETNQINN
ncbi:MAG: hypothetical protein AMXMBFR51_21030 [Ignavibacteriota bacterium]